METSELNKVSSPKERSRPRKPGLQPLTLILLGILACVGAIAASWFAGSPPTLFVFSLLHAGQENPPVWLQVPEVSHPYYLLLPTVVLFLAAVAAMSISKQPRTWSRVIVVSILSALTIRYVLWRSLTTLNFSEPVNGFFSLALFFLEILSVATTAIQLYFILGAKDRRSESDRHAARAIATNFAPSVDILVPTYNEATFILRRTIVGCQALDYARKKIYLLDDKRRPEMKQLARELGCEYITRPDNRHAKAGNLNNALPQTDGELVVVFDADFVPTKNFLARTVGWFQDEKIGLVQTPQNFYNHEPLARNLGLEEFVTSEEEIFYRFVQPIRDGASGLVCTGTSFIVRRWVLEAAGGFVTDSITEDYFTGVRISALGYKLVYLNEKLSAGLATENVAASFAQQMRWTAGTFQGLFIDSNPFLIPGLSLQQRLINSEGFLHWFTSVLRLGFLLTPIICGLFGLVPLRTTMADLVYFFLPYYLLKLATTCWLNYKSRSIIISDIYQTFKCFALSLTVFQTLLFPFSKGFKVTPKGVSSDRFIFNWYLALPLIILGAGTALALYRSLFGLVPIDPSVVEPNSALNLVVFWSSYNLFAIACSLMVMLDAPQPDLYPWFNLRRVIQIKTNGQFAEESDSGGKINRYSTKRNSEPLWAITTAISEGGLEATLNRSVPLVQGTAIALEIMEEGIALQGVITEIGLAGQFAKIQIRFEEISSEQYRQLIEFLFCRPGRWQNQQTPGEVRSLWLLLLALLKPRFLCNPHKRSIQSVSQV